MCCDGDADDDDVDDAVIERPEIIRILLQFRGRCAMAVSSTTVGCGG